MKIWSYQKKLLILLIIYISTWDISSASNLNVMPSTDSWILPFLVQTTITNAMGEGAHIGSSSEAIDYGTGGGFNVYAPADGIILDKIYVNDPFQIYDFGNTLRIWHASTASYSFFAHLSSYASNIIVGGTVSQGQLLGTTGNTGCGEAEDNDPSTPQDDRCSIHLHFEARVNVVSGNIYSGQSIPISGIENQRFHDHYSPAPPNLIHNTSMSSGVALSNSSTSRHLSNYVNSPSNNPNVFVNLNNAYYIFSFGARPSTPNSTYATTFWPFYFDHTVGQWQAGLSSPTPSNTLISFAPNCTSYGEKCAKIYALNSANGTSVHTSVYYLPYSTVAPSFSLVNYNCSHTVINLEYSTPYVLYHLLYAKPTDSVWKPSYFTSSKQFTIPLVHPGVYIISGYTVANGWSNFSQTLITSPEAHCNNLYLPVIFR
jgi:murein DD-endopeptidase MepM/ murein hydrolase activator NlpD